MISLHQPFVPKSDTRSRRLCLLYTAGLLTALLLTAICVAQEKKPPLTENGPMKFHNLKVLKGLSADDLYTQMRSYDEALGVGCGFCHANGFAKDGNPHKLRARQMLLMTRKLNKSYPMLKGKIACVTCHAGKTQPANVLP